MQVHDELVLEVADEAIETLVGQMRTHMIRAADLSVPLKVDVGVGRNWDEARNACKRVRYAQNYSADIAQFDEAHALPAVYACAEKNWLSKDWNFREPSPSNQMSV